MSMTSCGPACARRAGRPGPVGRVVVAQVVGGDRREGPDELAGQLAISLRDPSRSVVEQLGQPIDAVDRDAPLPGQVVEPDVLELDPLRRRRRTARRAALER